MITYRHFGIKKIGPNHPPKHQANGGVWANVGCDPLATRACRRFLWQRLYYYVISGVRGEGRAWIGRVNLCSTSTWVCVGPAFKGRMKHTCVRSPLLQGPVLVATTDDDHVKTGQRWWCLKEGRREGREEERPDGREGGGREGGRKEGRTDGRKEGMRG